MSKYQEVTNNLEFAKELQRSFMALSQDVSKAVQCGLSAVACRTWALNCLSPALGAAASITEGEMFVMCLLDYFLLMLY